MVTPKTSHLTNPKKSSTNSRSIPSDGSITSHCTSNYSLSFTHRSTSSSPSAACKLLPRPVLPYAPIRQDERQHYLRLLHDQYVHCNRNFLNNSQSNDEITRKAVNEEFRIASSTKSKMEYLHVIKKIMFNLKKYGNEGGKTLNRHNNNINKISNIGMDNNNDNQTNHNHKVEKTGEKNSPRGLQSAPAALGNPPFPQYWDELVELCIPLERLKRHNYVIEVPIFPTSDYSPNDRINCGRCGTCFRISEISNMVKCTYHWGKINTSTYQNLNLGKKIYGTDYTNKTYSCCNEPVGQSNGCVTGDHHVFKFDNPIDLHYVKEFQRIEELRSKLKIDGNSKTQLLRKEKIKAIGVDCEMCYTDKGFEMMKISVVDFRTEKKLIDSIVHPDGDLIIDLNTHVSGVESIPKTALTFDELMIKLAHMTDQDTIIVGHGLENDLNVMRLIYPKIVDTAILFSENQVNVRRKDPLKKLAWKYLSENIQGKEHDSLEDAIVPIRIVKRHIQKLLSMKERNRLNRNLH